MSFSVRPEVLTALGTSLHDVVAGKVWEASNYSQKWIDADDGGWTFQQAREAVSEFEPIVTRGFGQLWVDLMNSAQALKDTADLYRRTDSATAAHVDAALPTPGPAPSQGGDIDVPDLGDFAGYLDVPSTHLDFQDFSSMVDDALSAAAGPAEALLALAEALGMPEPFGIVAYYVIGDWEGMARAGNAIDRLHTFLRRVGATVEMVRDSIPKAWKGHAAEAAYDYFDRLVTCAQTAADNLAGAAQTVLLQAETIRVLGDDLSNGFQDFFAALADEVLYAMAEANVEVPAVAFVAWVLELINRFKLAARIEKILSIAKTVKASVDTFVLELGLSTSSLDAFASGMQSVGAYTMPDVAGDGSNAPDKPPGRTGPR